MADGRIPLDARLYRAALRLCPAEFRRDHGDEMACDFDEARREAAMVGPKAMRIFRVHVGVDLARAIAVQWLRTGIPVIGCLALFASLFLLNAVASAARAVTLRMRVDRLPSDAVGVVLLSVVAVMVIVATIVFNHWVHRPRRIGRR